MLTGVQVDGLKEFRTALRRAEATSPRALTAALKKVGKPLTQRASELAPRRTGALAGGYTTRVRGATASIVNRVPYSAGAEWGGYGKWAGFLKYGARGEGRFAWKAVEENQDRLLDDIARDLRDVLTAYGWFRGDIGG